MEDTLRSTPGPPGRGRSSFNNERFSPRICHRIPPWPTKPATRARGACRPYLHGLPVTGRLADFEGREYYRLRMVRRIVHEDAISAP